MALTGVLDGVSKFVKDEVNYISHDLLDHNFASHHLYSRIHAVGLAAVETIGVAAGLASLVPLGLAFVIGEALYLPERLYNTVKYVSQELRDYYQNNSSDVLCRTSRFALGALSSVVAGVGLCPYGNTVFHAKYLKLA